tara:strand:+ start:3328 stop:3987 length:660 start_codon:yes stop_codon:yes gene_type:complete
MEAAAIQIYQKPPKRDVWFFISYARRNQQLAGSFMDLFLEQVGPAKNYRYHFWQDSEILVGDQWHEEIQKALEVCDLGILLLSPAFLNSQYISEQELPNYVGAKGKAVLPVLLQRVDFKLHDLKGLERFQFFRLNRPSFKHSKCYADCNSQQRRQFAEALFRETQQLLDELYLPAAELPEESAKTGKPLSGGFAFSRAINQRARRQRKSVESANHQEHG